MSVEIESACSSDVLMITAGLQRISAALPRWAAVVGIVCAAVFAVLAAGVQSLTMDEPYHILAGYHSLRYGQNTVDYAHPPLVKSVAALPLVLMDLDLFPPSNPSNALADSLRIFDDPSKLRVATWMCRGMVLLAFGLPFLALSFALGQQVAGRSVGIMLCVMLGAAFSVFPYLGIVQTDAGAGVGFLLALVAALRYQRTAAVRNLALMGIGLGVALAAKFSGVLLAPALALAVWPGSGRLREVGRAGLRFAAVAGVGVAVLWLSYLPVNRSYDSRSGRDAIRAYCENRSIKVVDESMRAFEPALLELEAVSPAAAQWWTGFVALATSNRIGVYPSFLLGEVSSRGWWYYFPLVLLIRVPLAILIASAAAMIKAGMDWSCKRAFRPGWRSRAGPVLTAAATVYLGAAMTSTVNVGIRHLLPIMPVLFLPAAVWAARSMRRAVLVGAVLVLEVILMAPFWMSATNSWFLGKHNPTRFALWAGDGDYGQNFRFLNEFCRDNEIDKLHVFYPGIDQRWLHAYVPAGALWKPGDPLVPGWYAVSTVVEQVVPAILQASPQQLHGYQYIHGLATDYAEAWRRVKQGTDLGYEASTFHIYLVGASPASTPASGERG